MRMLARGARTLLFAAASEHGYDATGFQQSLAVPTLLRTGMSALRWRRRALG
jgi:hypothetical protein